MPVDQWGFRADMVIDPGSPIARMNMGKLHEPAINRAAEFVRRRVKAQYDAGDLDGAAATLLDFYHDINPNYAKLVRQVKGGADGLRQHVAEAIHKGIYLHIPPFLNTVTGPNLLRLLTTLRTKWGVEWGPVTYTARDLDGRGRTFTTQYPVMIGSQYIYLLCKLPEPASPGVARVSQYGVPIKPASDAKLEHALSATPVKLGEDENRVQMMDVPIAEVTRLQALQANSPKGLRTVVEQLMTSAAPTAIARMPISNAELAATNAVANTMHHELATVGIESRRTRTTLTLPQLTAALDDDDVDPEERREAEAEDLPLPFGIPLASEEPPLIEGADGVSLFTEEGDLLVGPDGLPRLLPTDEDLAAEAETDEEELKQAAAAVKTMQAAEEAEAPELEEGEDDDLVAPV